MKTSLYALCVRVPLVLCAWLAISGCAGPRMHIDHAGHAGSRVAYENYGRGRQAVVFIHGWTCDRSFWNRQVPALQNKYRLILIDLPGHGQSDAPEVNYSIPYFADAVKAVLDDAGVRRAVLVGHSLGFSIAREFARKYPDQAIALASSDGSLLRPPTSDSPADVEAWRQRINGFIEKVTTPDPKTARAAFVESMFVESTPADVRMEVMTKMAQTPDHVAVSAITSLTDVTLWREEPMPLPVLAILAQNEKSPTDREAQWRRGFPNVEYHEWTGVGHFPMMEKPNEFNSLLDAFLTHLPW